MIYYSNNIHQYRLLLSIFSFLSARFVLFFFNSLWMQHKDSILCAYDLCSWKRHFLVMFINIISIIDLIRRMWWHIADSENVDSEWVKTCFLLLSLSRLICIFNWNKFTCDLILLNIFFVFLLLFANLQQDQDSIDFCLNKMIFYCYMIWSVSSSQGCDMQIFGIIFAGFTIWICLFL